MAKVVQNKREKVTNLFAYASDEINAADRDLAEEVSNDPRFKATYVSSRDASAKDHLQNVIKAVTWLKVNLGITGNIAPFTDAEIDALEREIREFDDGV